jgi:uncharacterized NAD(P)/FAD-binding protein YdhS
MSRKIVIIGAGFSGTTLAIRLAKEAVDAHIFLIEKSTEHLFRGAAYIKYNDSHLLNVKASDMGAMSENPNEFFEWLNQKYPNVFRPDEFVSRSLYGDYLTELISPLIDKKITIIQDEIIDLDQENKLVLGKKESYQADEVVLSVGANYFQEKFDKSLLAHKSIQILGTGLSAIDFINELVLSGYQGNIHLYSRRALLPMVHEASNNLKFEFDSKGIRLLDLFKKIRFATKSQRESQFIVHALRPHLSNLWQQLSSKEKRQFKKYLRPYWEVFRHRMSVNQFEILQKLKNENRLIISKVNSKLFDEVNLIDCRGFKPLLELSLYKAVIKRSIAFPDELGWGLCDIKGNWIKVLGPMQRYEKFEITAVKEIRDEVKALALSLQNSR